ncbi:hypothetical protein G9A89_001812 [Geosiphon pyriformis]|nr:hypothetical protein G9A89_001812 [Geosiphon pyriformis]
MAARDVYLPLLCSKLSIKHRNISNKLPIYDAATNLSTANLLATSTHHLSSAAPTHLSTAVSGNLSAPTNSNTAAELISKQNSKAKTDTAKLEIGDSGSPTDFQFYNTTIRILTMKFRYWNYLSLLVTPKDAPSNNPETNQKQSLTNNILLATVTNNKSLAVIFPFKLEETTPVPLFSGATLDTKPITTMYTDAKVDATKTSIGEIDNFPFEVNGIIISIKVLVMEAMQYQALTTNLTTPLIKFEEKKKPIWEAYQNTNQAWETDNTQKELNNWDALDDQNDKESEITNHVLHVELSYLTKKCGMTFLDVEKPATKHAKYSHDKHKLWRIAYAKAEGMTTSELLEIKNNPLSLSESKYVQTFNIFGNIEDDPEEFYEHYQHLTPTREEQEQHLKEINT